MTWHPGWTCKRSTIYGVTHRKPKIFPYRKGDTNYAVLRSVRSAHDRTHQVEAQEVVATFTQHMDATFLESTYTSSRLFTGQQVRSRGTEHQCKRRADSRPFCNSRTSNGDGHIRRGSRRVVSRDGEIVGGMRRVGGKSDGSRRVILLYVKIE